MDWRRWASIARLSIRKMCCPNGSKKLLAQKILASQNVGGRMDFLHEVQFFAGIGPAHFPADLRNAALSAFEEGAPFMGTALAEYKQCIGPRLSAIFTSLFQCLLSYLAFVSISGNGCCKYNKYISYSQPNF